MLIEAHMNIMPTSAKRACREGSLETDKDSSVDISPAQTPELEAVRPKTRKHPKSSLKAGNHFPNRVYLMTWYCCAHMVCVLALEIAIVRVQIRVRYGGCRTKLLIS